MDQKVSAEDIVKMTAECIVWNRLALLERL